MTGRGFGRGFGGRGGGRGWRNRFYVTSLSGWQRVVMVIPQVAPYAAPFAPAISAEQQIDAIKEQAEYFEDALNGMQAD